MPSLQTESLTLAYDQAAIIKSLSLKLPDNCVTSLVGPNGCGKSTLLRGLARLLKPKGGSIYLDGRSITSLPARELARQLGILPQSPVAPEGITVRELAAQGRYPHQRWFEQWSEEDERMTHWALELTRMTSLSAHPVDALSGGQRQRAWIAMTLAQNTQVILLDEPTTFLDIAHQIEVLNLLKQLNRSEGRTIVMVLHDLNLAARYADHVIAVSAGRVVASGSPQEVITVEIVRSVFNVEADIVPDPRTGVPLCIPHSVASEEGLAINDAFEGQRENTTQAPAVPAHAGPAMY
jgi:iron complex transport system ATP-binding protein